MPLADRIRGCLLLGALGDALGSACEGAGACNAADLQPGQITDDTQLTLATCEAIVAAGEVSPAQIAATFASWHRQRRFTGLGASTLKALTELEAGQHWALAGAKGERAAGNGAAMRIAPLAFCLNPFDDADRRTIRDICRITHQHDEAYIGSLAIAQSVYAVAQQNTALGDLPATISRSLPDSRVRDRLQELSALKNPIPIKDVVQQFGNSGFVAESVPFAIYSASRCDGSSEQLLREVASAGGDADTNAALTGQIIGAALGNATSSAAIYAQLPELITWRDLIEQFVSHCCQ